jgi:LEA14-like dessication related protein
MPSKINKLLIIGAAVAAYFLYVQKQAIGLLNYVIGSVALSFNGLTPVLKINVLIQNVSNQSFTVTSFVGNVNVAGSSIGSMSSFTEVVIPPASQVTYPVYATLNLLGAVSDLVNLIQSGSGTSTTITLKGFVNANGIVAPVSLDYKIGF